MTGRTEFSRMFNLRNLPAEPVTVEATAEERIALAKRFGIIAVEALTARADLEPTGGAILARGGIAARIVQDCAISGDPFTHDMEEAIALRFVTPIAMLTPDAEMELNADDLDDVEYDGECFDLGEAVAQTLGLAIDPYAEGPEADATRREKGIVSDEGNAEKEGPLAEALKGLKRES